MRHHDHRSTQSALPNTDTDEAMGSGSSVRVPHHEEGRKWIPIRLSTVVATAAMGLYFLVLVSGMSHVTNAAVACPVWSVCNGQPSLDFGIGLGIDVHVGVSLVGRFAAVFVGLCLVMASWVAWREPSERRIRATLWLTTVLYPVSFGVGTLAPDASGWLTAIHLVVATGIFSGLLVALCWQLEAEVPTETGSHGEDHDAGASPSTNVTRDDVVASRTERSARGERVSAQPTSDALGTAERGRTTTVVTRVQAYVALTKPKLMWLLCLVAITGIVLGADGIPPLRTAGATLLGGVLAIGASGTFNNVLERGRDERMARTADRPLVRETIPLSNALAFGIALSLASVVVFVAFVNVLAAALGLGAILFYSVGYTLVLKPHTRYNTVLGGIVGAFPALIGWAAVRNEIGLPAVVLGVVIVCWTPAHFYNLALAYEDDYRRAGFPMLPVVRGAALTHRHILGYFGATLASVALLGVLVGFGWLYAVTTLTLGAVFLGAIIALFHERTQHAAFRAFMVSNVFLGGTLLVIVIDVLA